MKLQLIKTIVAAHEQKAMTPSMFNSLIRDALTTRESDSHEELAHALVGAEEEIRRLKQDVAACADMWNTQTLATAVKSHATARRIMSTLDRHWAPTR